MAVKQTAGRDQLGDFAPKFAELNDDVLFGTVFRKSVALNHIAFDSRLLKREHKQRHTKQISCALFYTLLYII